MRTGPTEMLERLKTQANLTNLFPVGPPDNHAFATVQINIDQVQPRSSRK
jgi:hypothetical protein